MNVSSIELASLQLSCERINTPRSLCVYLMIKYKSYDEYLNLEIRPELYDSAHAYGLDYFVTKFLSKWKGFKIKGLDPEASAIGEWLSAEAQCSLANLRLRSHSYSSLTKEAISVEPILFLAQRKIRDILGPLLSFGTLSDHCNWSKGGTFDLRRGTHFTHKMTSKLTVTQNAFQYMSALVGHDPLWCESIGVKIDGPVSLLPVNFTFVKGNRLTTVPKNAKTDRCISIEPTANIYLQKGVGSYLRKRLKLFGVDLDDQSRNQQLAKTASINGLCTVDLSSASDTISIELVKTLLPFDWFVLLDNLRSKQTYFADKFVTLGKFSSMGNGFTFELESLIFYALTSAIAEQEGTADPTVSVYGDDIITNASLYPELRRVFAYVGFKINERKSFSYGRFFESCGSHYFDGCLVTPAYQKNVSDKREEIIRLHNRLFRWSERIGFEIFEVCLFLVKRFKTIFKDKHVPRIPRYAIDDSGFLSDLYHLRYSDPNNGYYCYVYRLSQRYKSAEQAAFFAYKLRQTSDVCYTSQCYNDECVVSNSLLSSDGKGQGFYTIDGRYRYSTAYFPVCR